MKWQEIPDCVKVVIKGGNHVYQYGVDFNFLCDELPLKLEYLIKDRTPWPTLSRTIGLVVLADQGASYIEFEVTKV